MTDKTRLETALSQDQLCTEQFVGLIRSSSTGSSKSWKIRSEDMNLRWTSQKEENKQQMEDLTRVYERGMQKHAPFAETVDKLQRKKPSKKEREMK